jgi:hypothetical protein
VYGRGPRLDPHLYEADRRHLLVQNPSANGVRDLPRAADGTAVIGDSRNDENEIISQLHTAFLLFHNAVIDEVTHSMFAAYETVVHYYQWAVLHDYLPRVCGADVVAATLAGNIPRFYRPGRRSPLFPDTPVEWSVAAFRFGHSEVRASYEVAEASAPIDVFSFTAPDLRGGRLLPGNRQIAWGNFFAELSAPADLDGINHSRKIDTLISLPLFQLAIPPVEAQGSNVLAFRNMIRGLFYGLPSGQSVAAAMGTPVYPPKSVTTISGFDRGTPLWYYNLYDSAAAGGLKLGPLGARIVADVLIRLLQIDPTSILNVPFRPRPPIAPAPGEFKLADLLVYAGVATRP